jgi:transcriptional regulator with XRE-family HTH domain
MNLVQSTIEGYLRQGFSQTELARKLGIDISDINAALRGRRDPGPKLLNALGIERHVSYLLKAPKLMNPINADKQPKRPKTKAPKQLEIKGIDPVPPKLKPRGMKPEHVSTAIKYKLNPGSTWAAFIAEASSAGDMWKKSFEDFCQERGSEPKPVNQPKEQVFAPIGHGDAVALKPQAVRADFRAPLQPGQLRVTVQDVQPEVTVKE